MPTQNQLLIFAAMAGNCSLVEERIAAGADVSYSDERLGSALLQAIRCHHHEVVQLLIARGVDVRSVDSHGQGVLEYALHGNDDSMVALLLNAGAQLQSHALPRFRDMLTASLARAGMNSRADQAVSGNRR
jgi:ankyrin repeat protein